MQRQLKQEKPRVGKLYLAVTESFAPAIFISKTIKKNKKCIEQKIKFLH